MWSEANTKENHLFEDNMGLIYMVLKRFANRGYDMEELFQVGSIGLIKAVDRYDETQGYAFSTYAVPLIIGEIRRFLRDDGMIHISRQIKDNARKIAIVREQLKKTDNYDPSIDELANACGLEREEVIMAIGTSTAVESIYQPVSGGKMSDAENVLTVADQLADDRNEQETMLNRMAVRQLIEELDGQSKELICLRYLQGLTQMQVAKAMGINQVAVSRLEKKILLQMRKRF